jgi:hypothetical protein
MVFGLFFETERELFQELHTGLRPETGVRNFVSHMSTVYSNIRSLQTKGFIQLTYT